MGNADPIVGLMYLRSQLRRPKAYFTGIRKAQHSMKM
jgi:hypothetical protein